MTNRRLARSKPGCTAARTFVDVLRTQADALGSSLAYRFLLDGDITGRSESLTFQELDRWAKAMAVQLRAVASPGDRILLMPAPGIDYVAAFYGCLYAGMVAVPLFPPETGR